ncbi:MAG: CRISPR-associated helicase Cas3' [Chloroflexi bacterium]|nr:CRISPR-associated helicase Cas3' [Chloroflexota bacterium]
MTRAEARPGQPLVEHLGEVARAAREALDHPALRARDVLARVAYLAGATHDVGKYTTFFQDYLHTKRSHNGREHHAFPSALLAAWLALQTWPERDPTRREAYLPLLAFLVIHRHHGHLQAPEDLVPHVPDLEYDLSAWLTGNQARLPSTLQRFVDQWRDLGDRTEVLVEELASLGLEGDAVRAFLENPETVGETLDTLERLGYFLSKAEGGLSEADRARLALWGQLLFSALIDADKRSAAGLPPLPPRPHLPGDLAERYVAHKYPRPRHDLDRERAAFFRTVTERARQVPIPPSDPLALTAPTGMGKTLAALSAAFVLRERLAEHYGVTPRIVYALPFINLIEQNYAVVEDILTWGLPDFPANRERYLIKHHHLAEIEYRVDDENLPVAEALLLTEGWESEIVVTTFVQVFHTLLGHQNRLLRKLHNVIGGVLILDELQSLKMEYWPLARRIFQVLREEMGLTVIQMTATRPLIFVTEKTQPDELYPEPQQLFNLMHRTVLEVDLAERSIEALADEVIEIAETHDSVLVVVNTVGDSLRLYQTLREKDVGTPVPSWKEGRGFPLAEDERALVYLSTNIVPLHRSQRLAFLRAWLEAKGRAVLVATQVVEAGVDLDFTVAVRDLGPLDSIVQVAGRCNREGRRTQGLVLVRKLKDSKANLVYGTVHMNAARELLKGIVRLEEPEFARLVEHYFEETQRWKSQEESDLLWGAYLGLRYDGKNCGNVPCLSNFRLIDEMPSVPVFVTLTEDDAAWLAEVFTPEVLEEEDFRRRREAYLHHRRYLHERIIQVPEFRAEKNPPPEWRPGLRWVPLNQWDEFYDLETGFRWVQKDLDRAWIV